MRQNHANGRVLLLDSSDPTGQPVYYTTHGATPSVFTRTTALYANGGLDVALSGNLPALTGKLGIWDGGAVLATHQELGTTRVQTPDNAIGPLSDHATHLTGIMIGAGVSPTARGMAFGARLSVWDYTNDVVEIAANADKLLISNHAYGPVVGWVRNPNRPGNNPDLQWEWWGNTSISTTEDYLFGFYTDKARDLDRIAYSNPYWLMVRSADNKHSETGPPVGVPYFLRNTNQTSALPRARNDAYDVIPAEATAKNGLTVGSAEVTLDAQNQPGAFTVSTYSDWGPTDDGRIKPDLLGIGTGVYSSISTGNAAYGTLSGTSMASAGVSGSLLLLQELFARERGGAFMRSATLRGLVLHTADRLNPALGPDYRQGWGLLNVEAAARIVQNADRSYLLTETSLVNKATFTQKITASGTQPLIVTICWTDPEGAASPVSPWGLNSRAPKLVNDLDLRLSDGTTVALPWTLDPAQPAQAARRSDNIRDNVEQIRIEKPVPGRTYTISVTHKNMLTYNSQPFSLIVSGLDVPNCQVAVSLTSSRDTMLCAGDVLTLTSNRQQPGDDYRWFRNGLKLSGYTDPTYSTRAVGQYTVQVTDARGCVGMSAPVQVRLSPLDSANIFPNAPELILPLGASVHLRTSGDANYTYQWFLEGKTLIDATTPQIQVSEPGSYQVRVRQAHCTQWSPTCQIRLATADAPNRTNVPDSLLTFATDDEALLVYPSPANTTLTIRYRQAALPEITIGICDERGSLICPLQTLRQSATGQFQADVSLQSWATGIYYVLVQHGSTVLVRRFLKQE